LKSLGGKIDQMGSVGVGLVDRWSQRQTC
jgi:hypothetical protein